MTFLLAYCVLSTTSIVALTAAVLYKLGTGDDLIRHDCRNGRYFEGVFGGDEIYMSVDHKFDNLWENLGGKALIIQLPDESYDGQATPASISIFTASLHYDTRSNKLAKGMIRG
ncbi:hypothetical protein GQ53DRAFT_825744 [Thozetella sp. PMI_491]|nr:hypothetical protein GQ53DRAFT_825744 [Thozetella sp. PMI_491]